MKVKLVLAAILFLNHVGNLSAQQTDVVFLSGKDKDHTVEWEFLCTKGRNSGKWTTIPVPSNWECQGFGEFTYGRGDKKIGEEGLYKFRFSLPENSFGKKIFLVFEGVMADAEVKVNGKPAGEIHQGGFYQFRYDITRLIKSGKENLLEVKVQKVSSNESVYRAECDGDFWCLGGIFRPVYLEIKPKTFIDRVAIDAKASGSFSMDVFTGNIMGGYTIEAQIQTLKGENFGKSFHVKVNKQSQSFNLRTQVDNPKQWNPESPSLYQVMAMLKDQRGQTIHTVTQRFGFRTVEVRQGDGIYVNNTRIIFKGANRHSFWPASGRTLSREVHLMDINLMKEMNMNAVRMSHYPPDQDFLDLCDSLGLFVLDELTGWQAKYDSVVGRKLVKELIRRDVNHPSIVLWANGNEGGWNTALDDDFKSEDIQQRFVYHPWGKFRGTDTKHYPDYNYVVNSALYGTDIFFPTEFMHGLYDGGHGAGLSDFWEKMLAHPFGAGGFLWALVDEGIVRPDKGNTIDTHSNSAPDGIVGPFREKEGSFYAIKEIWSPVKIRKSGEGFIIENHFLFTDLSECTYRWELDALSYQGSSQVFISKGTGTGTINKIAAGQSGDLELNLPADWPANDRLSVIIQGPGQREVYRKTWSLRSPAETAAVLTKPAPSLSQAEIVDEGNQWTIRCDGLQYRFSKSSGYLSAVVTQKNLFSLNGPRHAGFQHELKSLMHHREGAAIVFEANYSSGDNWFKSTWTFDAGRPVRLDYQYSQRGECDFMGLTFQYPEEKIQSIRWLGQGPYRVWKNRMEGTQFGIWEKTFNNTVTGEQWQYPEFKGYHAGVHWVELKNTEGTFTVICENRNVFLHMLTPGKPQGAYNDYTSPPFPDGNISFLQAISPIGTKFQPAQVMGPSSQKNMMLNYTPVSGTLWFDFTN